jgi:hypothetical protein
MENQYKLVKEHLITNGNITSWEAITKYRITRLSHFIYVLRKEGYDITSVWKTNNKKRFVEYRLNSYEKNHVIFEEVKHNSNITSSDNNTVKKMSAFRVFLSKFNLWKNR